MKNGLIVFSLICTLITCLSYADVDQTALNFPGGKDGVGFDDMNFASTLDRVLVPGGATGELGLINPNTKQMIFFGKSHSMHNYSGGHGEGVTSADEGDGYIFTIDRTAMTVNVIDPNKKNVMTSVSLASSPDYVRYVNLTKEVWVTEPDNDRIEIFAFSKEGTVALKHLGFIPVAGGPESLVIDGKRQRAYTHLWKATTIAIDLKTHTLTEEWPNGCVGSRGIAVDVEKGFLFAGCAEGKAVVLDLNNKGRIVGVLKTGLGIDVIGYNKDHSHLYLAGAQSATLSIIDVLDNGELKLLGLKNTAKGSHCVASDNREGIWVCDPAHGRILFFKDQF